MASLYFDAQSNLLRQKGLPEAPSRFELEISCLLDRRFNQLSHGAGYNVWEKFIVLKYCRASGTGIIFLVGAVITYFGYTAPEPKKCHFSWLCTLLRSQAIFPRLRLQIFFLSKKYRLRPAPPKKLGSDWIRLRKTAYRNLFGHCPRF